MKRVRASLNLEKYGLGNLEFALTSYVADIKTIRLINDASAPYISGYSLSTTNNDNNVPKVGR
jgi:hypothetical protein